MSFFCVSGWFCIVCLKALHHILMKYLNLDGLSGRKRKGKSQNLIKIPYSSLLFQKISREKWSRLANQVCVNASHEWQILEQSMGRFYPIFPCPEKLKSTHTSQWWGKAFLIMGDLPWQLYFKFVIFKLLFFPWDFFTEQKSEGSLKLRYLKLSLESKMNNFNDTIVFKSIF